jgi:hypothetical protein
MENMINRFGKPGRLLNSGILEGPGQRYSGKINNPGPDLVHGQTLKSITYDLIQLALYFRHILHQGGL